MNMREVAEKVNVEPCGCSAVDAVMHGLMITRYIQGEHKPLTTYMNVDGGIMTNEDRELLDKVNRKGGELANLHAISGLRVCSGASLDSDKYMFFDGDKLIKEVYGYVYAVIFADGYRLGKKSK